MSLPNTSHDGTPNAPDVSGYVSQFATAAKTEQSTPAERRTIPSLDATFRALAKQHAFPVPYLRAAMRVISQSHQHIAFMLKGRLGADTLADFAAIDAFTSEQITSLKTLLNSENLKRHGEHDAAVSGPYPVGDRKLHLLTVPVQTNAEPALDATLTVAVDASPDPSATWAANRLATAELKSSIASALVCMPTKATKPSQLDESLDRVQRVMRYSSTREFAFALVNSLAGRYQCASVAFGIEKQNRIAMLAISGTDSFKASSPGVVDIQQAMEEAYDARSAVWFDERANTTSTPPQGAPALLPVHRQLGTNTRTAVCSVPLMAGESCVGIVTLQRDPKIGFRAEELSELKQTIEPFGAAVELALRGERPLKQHFAESAREGIRRVRQPQSRLGGIARVAILAAAAIFLFGWMPYRPMTPCVVVPADLTQSLAPFDMQLNEALVRSGDRVRKGQVLATFDTRQLELERAQLHAQQQQAEVDVRAALVQGDAAAASLAKANASVYATQLSAVTEKIALCTIAAPADGMVVEADLEQRIGQVLGQGTPLLSFSPMSAFKLEIRVPEHQARYIQASQQGTFAPTANPSEVMTYTVDRVAGSAELIDGQNVFVATAIVDGKSDDFRYGTQGFARTSTGYRPIPWITFHRIYEYACANFWL